MAEETHSVPKSLVDSPDHNGESKAWGAIARAQDINAQAIVRTEHTDDDYVFIVDRDLME